MKKSACSGRSVFGAIALALCGFVASCSSDEPAAVPAQQACTPGQQTTCPCVGGVNGVQACKGDGSGFDACQCPDASIDSSSGGTGGSAGTGGAAGTAGTGGSGGEPGGDAGDASVDVADAADAAGGNAGSSGTGGVGGDASVDDAIPADVGSDQLADGEPPDVGDAMADGSSDSEAGTGCVDTPELDLAGNWALVVDYVVTTNERPGGFLKLCPTSQAGTAKAVFVVALKHVVGDKKNLEVGNVTACSFSLPGAFNASLGQCSSNLISTELQLSAAMNGHLADVQVAASSGALSGLTAGATVTFAPFGLTLGSTKSGTFMPRWVDTNSGCGVSNTTVGHDQTCVQNCVSDCAATVDQDFDGWTGVTMTVCGRTAADGTAQCDPLQPNNPGITLQGRTSVALETAPQLAGQVPSSCRISGTATAPITYNVVGANVYLSNALLSTASVAKALPTFDVSSATFRMIRVDGKYNAPNWQTCTDVLAHQSEIQ